jgi:deoxyadenosine/deoxycytidine kinase
MKHLVMVSGNLGVGKTTVAELIAKRLGWNLVAEALTDNPYLSDFYADMKAWSFHLQVFFLGVRAERHLAACDLPKSAIFDRSVYDDSQVFARTLHDLGYVTHRDFETYLRLANLVTKKLRPPDLVLYLTAPVDTLVARIRARGARSDRGVSREYLSAVQSAYDNWISTFDMCPAIPVDTSVIDYGSDTEQLDALIASMVRSLSPEQQRPLS